MVPDLSGIASARTAWTRRSGAVRLVVAASLVAVAAAGCRDRDDAKVEHVDAYLPNLNYYESTPARDTMHRQVGTLVNGKRHGLWRIYDQEDPERVEELEHWKHGVKHGPSLYFREDGTLAIDKYYRNGKVHGRVRHFDELGKLEELGWAADDEREGIWCYWDIDGALERMRHWRRDRIDDIEVGPGSVCPHLRGSGRRHLNPYDRNYD